MMRSKPERTIRTEPHCGECDALVEWTDADFTKPPPYRVRCQPCGHESVMIFKPVGVFGIVANESGEETAVTERSEP